jgi:purine-nucleoside phosphorylase
MFDQVQDAVGFLKSQGVIDPEVAVILGTGLGNSFIEHLRNAITIEYRSIPHFPISTVEFHKGRLIFGEVRGKKVKRLLISNAAGNLNLDWKKGELMLIDDHINLQSENPLRGRNDDRFGPRFPDMSAPYSKTLNDELIAIAKEKNIKLNVGVYVGVAGPNLETRAEYRFLRRIGADAVGMSTVPEVIVANHMHLACCAVSVLTDDCDPDNLKPASFAEIIEVAGKSEGKLTELYVELINRL